MQWVMALAKATPLVLPDDAQAQGLLVEPGSSGSTGFQSGANSGSTGMRDGFGSGD